MKKIFLITLFLAFFTTGCVSYTELNELGIVSAVGIDYQDGEYYITTNFVLPEKDDGESTYQMETFQSNSSSLEDAFNKIYLKSNKKIYLSHVELVAISENVAKNELSTVTNYFLQNEQSRNAFPLVLVKDSSPSKLLELQEAPDMIEHLLEINRQEYGTTFLLSLEDFSRMLLNQDTAVLPTITIEDVPTTHGLAMIKEKKLIGYLSLEESNAYLFLTNKIAQMNLSLTCGNTPIEVSVKENTTLLSHKENTMMIELQSKIQGKQELCSTSLTTLYEDEIKRRIEGLLNKTKTENIDLLQFTTYIYRNDYRYFKKHPNLFSNLNYDIRFQTELLLHNNKTKGGLS